MSHRHFEIFGHHEGYKPEDVWGHAEPMHLEMREILGKILHKLEKIMATLADVTAAVARNTDAEDAALTYLKDISQKLKDALAANDPAALATLVAQIDANTAKAAAAIVQDTPAATP